MRMTRVGVVLCALLALPSALLAQKRQRNHGSSTDPVRIAPTGVTADQRHTIGRYQRGAKSAASWLMNAKKWPDPVLGVQFQAQAVAILDNLQQAIFNIGEADKVATASQKRHLKEMASDDQDAILDGQQVMAEAKKPKPDLIKIEANGKSAFTKVQQALKINANKANWK